MYLADFPYHIVQRGNNREACFIEPETYPYYLELLKEVSLRYDMAIHSYCLIIATAGDKTSISSTMKVVGSRYSQYINKKYDRTGTLWEGRHKSSLVQSDKYFNL